MHSAPFFHRLRFVWLPIVWFTPNNPQYIETKDDVCFIGSASYPSNRLRRILPLPLFDYVVPLAGLCVVGNSQHCAKSGTFGPECICTTAYITLAGSCELLEVWSFSLTSLTGDIEKVCARCSSNVDDLGVIGIMRLL